MKYRVEDQLNWYTAKSKSAQIRYKTLRVASIAISLSIPILMNLIGGKHDPFWKVIISMEAAMVALIEGVLSLYKYKDIWTSYSSTSEQLKYHKFLFKTQTTPYNSPDAFQQFVSNVESIMQAEQKGWVTATKAMTEDNPVARTDYAAWKAGQAAIAQITAASSPAVPATPATSGQATKPNRETSTTGAGAQTAPVEMPVPSTDATKASSDTSTTAVEKKEDKSAGDTPNIQLATPASPGI